LPCQLGTPGSRATPRCTPRLSSAPCEVHHRRCCGCGSCPENFFRGTQSKRSYFAAGPPPGKTRGSGWTRLYRSLQGSAHVPSQPCTRSGKELRKVLARNVRRWAPRDGLLHLRSRGRCNVWSFNTAKGKLAQVNTQEIRGCPAARLTESRAPRLHSGFGSLFVQ